MSPHVAQEATRRWLVWSWVGVLGPLLGSMAVGGMSGLLPHPIYHLVYIVLSLGAWYACRRLRRSATSRGGIVLARILVLSVVVDVVGQAGQEVVVLLHGGFHAGPHVLTEPVHLAFALLSGAAITVSLVVLVAISRVVMRAG